MSKKKAYRVILTRSTDIFVPLDERTRRAHAAQADLFISIHANYAKPSISGIETFWFCAEPALESQEQSTLRTPHEVRASFKKRGTESASLASYIHTSLYSELKKNNPTCVDRRVRKGGIQVLMGAHMPAVLIEVGFLSNQKEAQLLKTKAYQQKAAQGMCEGIERYITQKRTVKKI